MSLKQIAIALDQLVNAIFGGWADETLSARFHRTNSPLKRYVDAAFFWEEDHCLSSYQAEHQRRQLPPAYRRSSP